MNYNSTYARAAICGDVSIDPERQVYGENNSKELVKFAISVTIPGYNGAAPTYMPFQIVAFGKQAELALTLKRYQRVLVICDLKNRQKEVKGALYDNISVTAQQLLPFPMPKQEQQGQQQPQQPAPAPQNQQQGHQPRILQQQGLTPQQDMQQRMQQQAQQTNTDIPF